MVNWDRQTCYCFGCGKGGAVDEFVAVAAADIEAGLALLLSEERQS